MPEQENKPQPKPETTKFDGVSAQINLSPGSETHQRFARLMRSTSALTARAFVDMLMDVYETPHTDNSEVIENLQLQLSEAKENIESAATLRQNYENEIADLKLQLEAARNNANENAAKAQQIQTSTEGCIIIKPNPVVAYFLNEMAQHEKTTPAKILERLFVDDLQNPRANNLPYTVESSRIREVMNELKQQQ
jgi:hypothetical protein